jgi:hypothetical protein
MELIAQDNGPMLRLITSCETPGRLAQLPHVLLPDAATLLASELKGGKAIQYAFASQVSRSVLGLLSCVPTGGTQHVSRKGHLSPLPIHAHACCRQQLPAHTHAHQQRPGRTAKRWRHITNSDQSKASAPQFGSWDEKIPHLHCGHCYRVVLLLDSDRRAN